jgi:hypothetical protein
MGIRFFLKNRSNTIIRFVNLCDYRKDTFQTNLYV